MIEILKQKLLDHKGGVYVYRVHKHKLESAESNEISKLKNYLYNVFEECPDAYFNNGNLRSSGLKFKVNVDVKSLNQHEVNMLCAYGLMVNNERYKSNHSRVQVFMLEHDKKTIAAEVPIWVEKEELPMHKGVFKSCDILTGHIDLLRFENEKIWIWDYKPNANREEYAATQLYFYALMLSKRTGIDLSNFMCGYFDSDFAYAFDPNAKCSSLLDDF